LTLICLLPRGVPTDGGIPREMTAPHGFHEGPHQFCRDIPLPIDLRYKLHKEDYSVSVGGQFETISIDESVISPSRFIWVAYVRGPRWRHLCKRSATHSLVPLRSLGKIVHPAYPVCRVCMGPLDIRKAFHVVPCDFWFNPGTRWRAHGLMS
jgi:hypothetical protein